MSINVSFKNESAWIVKGTIKTDFSISDCFYTDDFKIQITDVFEHYVKRSTNADFQRAFNIEKTHSLLEITSNNIDDYTNDDISTLITNGVQFWIDVNEKILHFRFVARGQSTSNPPGYYDDIIGDYSGRVGFNVAKVKITFDEDNETEFTVCINPKLMSSPIYRINNEAESGMLNGQTPSTFKTCPICNGEGTILDGVDCPACSEAGASGYYQDRTDFDQWEKCVYLNNFNSPVKVCSAQYKQVWNEDTSKYDLIKTTEDCTQTPVYGVITSAFIPTYLMTGETIDILTSATAVRDFDYNWSSANSWLYETENKYTDLEWTSGKYDLSSFVYLSADNSAKLYDDMTVYLIKQKIELSSTDVTGCKVYFGVEV